MMNILRYPEKSTWPELLQRPALNHLTLEDQVQKIIDEVKANGDAAVKSYSLEFDRYDAEFLEVRG